MGRLRLSILGGFRTVGCVRFNEVIDHMRNVHSIVEDKKLTSAAARQWWTGCNKQMLQNYKDSGSLAMVVTAGPGDMLWLPPGCFFAEQVQAEEVFGYRCSVLPKYKPCLSAMQLTASQLESTRASGASELKALAEIASAAMKADARHQEQLATSGGHGMDAATEASAEKKGETASAADSNKKEPNTIDGQVEVPVEEASGRVQEEPPSEEQLPGGVASAESKEEKKNAAGSNTEESKAVDENQPTAAGDSAIESPSTAAAGAAGGSAKEGLQNSTERESGGPGEQANVGPGADLD